MLGAGHFVKKRDLLWLVFLKVKGQQVVMHLGMAYLVAES